jgi:hypothetical protein
VTVEWFQCVQTVSGEARGTHVFNLAAPRAAATLRRPVRTSVIRHRTFRLNLRLRETELRLERLAPTESAFANRRIGPKGISIRTSGGDLSRSPLVPLRPFREPAQFRQQTGELGTSGDRVHGTYLDSDSEEQLRGRPARHTLENSCSMSRAPSRPHSTPMCIGTMGEQ